MLKLHNTILLKIPAATLGNGDSVWLFILKICVSQRYTYDICYKDINSS